MFTRIVGLLASACFISAAALAADDSFVGKWKLNPDKSQFTGIPYKIEDVGGNKYNFAFGDDVETIPLDGKDHATKYGNTWAITKTGPNQWKWTRKREAKSSPFPTGPFPRTDKSLAPAARVCDPTDRPLTKN